MHNFLHKHRENIQIKTSAQAVPALPPSLSSPVLGGFGCSACAWETEDGQVLWGRNFDYNRIARGTSVTFVPRGTGFYTCGAQQEGNLMDHTFCRAVHSCIGTGLLIPGTAPALYEGLNDAGLMGAQLYYREFAHFDSEPLPNRLPVQPAFLVTYLLAMCSTVEEAADALTHHLCLAGIPLLGAVPTIHWMFTDAGGESIVVEPDADGLHIYRNTLGIMTNSPGYPWHRLNLLNYSNLDSQDKPDLLLAGQSIPQCFSGSGALGLPGDWSSPSRFVRLAFLREHCPRGRSEAEGVAYLFRMLQNVAFPIGAVEVSHPGTATDYDTGLSPYDYTLYSCVMSSRSLKYYWMTYQNTTVHCANLRQLDIPGQGKGSLAGCRQFSFDFSPSFCEESSAKLSVPLI